jgi:hypothetical protein
MLGKIELPVWEPDKLFLPMRKQISEGEIPANPPGPRQILSDPNTRPVGRKIGFERFGEDSISVLSR